MGGTRRLQVRLGLFKKGIISYIFHFVLRIGQNWPHIVLRTRQYEKKIFLLLCKNYYSSIAMERL